MTPPTPSPNPAGVPGRVSVIVPTHDRADRCGWTIAGLLAQDHPDLEVVVVDDASTDATPDFLARIAATEPRLRVLRHEQNLGTAAARNTGAEAATGEWLAFCDDDDWWMPTKASAQLGALRRDRARWCVVTSVNVADHDLSPVELHHALPRSLPDDLHRWNQVPGGGSGVMVHRTLLAEAGGFEPAQWNLEDWDCWIRLAECDPHPVSIDEPLVVYVEHPGQGSLQADRAIEMLFLLADRHRVGRGRAGLGDRDLHAARWVVQRTARRDGSAAALGLCWRLRRRLTTRILAGCLLSAATPGWVRRLRRTRRTRSLQSRTDVAAVVDAARRSRASYPSPTRSLPT